ncbi:AMP-binding protein [Priestia filamentosa]|uniref:AMP-binding protein n=1 Tax=Priestia filamentosa TaxID=1402861 RepID=UPI003981FD59
MSLEIPTKINLYEEFKKQAKKNPKKVILEDLESALTYKEVLLSVNVLSQRILQSTSDETRVGLFLPNVAGQVIVLFSLFKNGQVPCVLNFSMGALTLLDCIETAALKTVITSKAFVEVAGLAMVIEEMEKKVHIIYVEDLKENISVTHKIKGFIQSKVLLPTIKGEDEIILFTSGTESKPKGVVLTHRNIYANIKQALAVIEITSEDRIFNPLPLFHSFGLTVCVILPLISNIKTFLYPSPLHYKVIPKMMKKDKSTITLATNTFLDQYAKYAKPEDLVSLRYVIAGGEKLKEDVAKTYVERFSIEILQGYGATETSPIIALNTPSYSKLGSVGKIIPLMEAKIEKIEGINDGGNLLVKGPNMMKGYLIHNKGFVPSNEWYNTGDIARIDGEGYLHILSRLKRFSKIAGEMVSLNQIEYLAYQCFMDSNFYAVSIPDKRKGEKIILFTTIETANIKELKRFIKSKKVSSLYLPRQISVIDDIPLLGSGKPDYRELEKLASKL